MPFALILLFNVTYFGKYMATYEYKGLIQPSIHASHSYKLMKIMKNPKSKKTHL